MAGFFILREIFPDFPGIFCVEMQGTAVALTLPMNSRPLISRPSLIKLSSKYSAQ